MSKDDGACEFLVLKLPSSNPMAPPLSILSSDVFFSLVAWGDVKTNQNPAANHTYNSRLRG